MTITHRGRSYVVTTALDLEILITALIALKFYEL